MRPAPRLDPGRATVLAVDLQERFAPAIEGWEEIVRRSALLLEGAALLGVPVLATEQYPKGLGRTVAPIAAALNGATPIEKTCFDATGAAGFDLDGRDQVILCGIETHICVLQSALSLLDDGVEVFLALDSTGSRRERDREPAVRRMLGAGVVATTAEAAGFEMLATADAPGFRAFQELVK